MIYKRICILLNTWGEFAQYEPTVVHHLQHFCAATDDLQLFLTHTHSLAHTHTNTTHTHTHTHKHHQHVLRAASMSFFLSLLLPLTHSPTHNLSHTHTHTRAHTYTHTTLIEVFNAPHATHARHPTLIAGWRRVCSVRVHYEYAQ